MKDIRTIELRIGDTIVSIGADSRVHYVPERDKYSTELVPVTGVEIETWNIKNSVEEQWTTKETFPSQILCFGLNWVIAPCTLRQFAEGLIRLLDKEEKCKK